MTEVQAAIYFVIIFFYCFFYYMAMSERKEDRVHNFLSVVIFVLACASIVFPLCFDRWWKFVALVSVSMIVATVFTDDSKPSSASNHDPIGMMVSFGGHFLLL